jgi:hypothetical protein
MIERAERERQPHSKSYYRATPSAIENYRDWLVGQVVEVRRNERLIALQLAALARVPENALNVLRRCEQTCREESERVRASSSEDDGPPSTARLIAGLTAEEDRLAVQAKLAWIDHAQRQLADLTQNNHRPQEIPAR